MYTIFKRTGDGDSFSLKQIGQPYTDKSSALLAAIGANEATAGAGLPGKYVVFDSDGNEIKPYRSQAVGEGV